MTNEDQTIYLPEGMRNSLSVLLSVQRHREVFVKTTESVDPGDFFIDERHLYDVGRLDKKFEGLGLEGKPGLKSMGAMKRCLREAQRRGYVQKGTSENGEGYRIAHERREVLERMFGGAK